MASTTDVFLARKGWACTEVAALLGACSFAWTFALGIQSHSAWVLAAVPLTAVVLLCTTVLTGGQFIRLPRRRRSLLRETTALLAGLGLGLLLVLVIDALLLGIPDGPTIVLSQTGGSGLALSAIRVLEFASGAGHRRTRVLLAAIEPELKGPAEEAIAALPEGSHAEEVVCKGREPLFPGLPALNERQLIDAFKSAKRRNDCVLIVVGRHYTRDDAGIHDLARTVFGSRVPMVEFVQFYEALFEKALIYETSSDWIVDGNIPGFRSIDRVLKRAFDIGLVLVLLPLLLPLIALLSAWIRLESDGPAIFQQDRTGENGKPYVMLKLRTMRLHADDSHRWPNFEADLVTKFGAFLRRTGLDEVPQLFNVLKGEMSFIGPRPARPMVAERHVHRLPIYAVTYSIKPGITGWAQVHQGQDAGDDTMIEKTRYTLYYVKNFSFLFDLRILFRTAAQLLSGKKRVSKYIERLDSRAPQDDSARDKASAA